MIKVWLGGAAYMLTKEQHDAMNLFVADTLPRKQEEKALEYIDEQGLEPVQAQLDEGGKPRPIERAKTKKKRNEE